MLEAAGWAVQDPNRVDLRVSRGIAIREFPLKAGHGHADYMLYVDGRAAGVVEAKKQGTTLTGVEIQSEKYSQGLPAAFPAYLRPLPFCYQSTGTGTRFTSGLDPDPRSRPVFWFSPARHAGGMAGDSRCLGPPTGTDRRPTHVRGARDVS